MTQVLYKGYLVWFLIGCVLLGFDLIPPWLEWANSVFLILSGSLAVLYAMVTFGKQKGIWLSLLIFLTTFIIEGFSAHYDIFFGSYDYTSYFPPTIFGVPVGIGFAWISMIMGGHAFTVHIRSRFTRAFIAALYAVALDLILDPVAFVVKNYWIWEGTSVYYNIPLTNFLGWFVIAICWQLVLVVQPVTVDAEIRKKMMVVFWTIVILFVWVALLEKLFLALIVTALAFLVLEALRRWLHEKK